MVRVWCFILRIGVGTRWRTKPQGAGETEFDYFSHSCLLTVLNLSLAIICCLHVTVLLSPPMCTLMFSLGCVNVTFSRYGACFEHCRVYEWIYAVGASCHLLCNSDDNKANNDFFVFARICFSDLLHLYSQYQVNA